MRKIEKIEILNKDLNLRIMKHDSFALLDPFEGVHQLHACATRFVCAAWLISGYACLMYGVLRTILNFPHVNP